MARLGPGSRRGIAFEKMDCKRVVRWILPSGADLEGRGAMEDWEEVFEQL